MTEGSVVDLMKWLWLVLAVVVLILVPFFLFEEYFTGLAERAASGSLSTPLAVGVIGGLLAFDVLLPVPSSVVSAAAGVLLGFWLGAAVVWIGMMLSCVMAYAIGSRSSRLAGRIVGDEGLHQAAELAGRYGMAAIAMCRPVPVLAEASVIVAGVARVPVRRFLLVCALSNLGIALGYAAIGAFAMTLNSFLVAFLGAMLLPAVAWLVTRIWTTR